MKITDEFRFSFRGKCMNGIPNSLTFYKVTFHGEAYVLAESEEEARKAYRERANYLNEIVDEVRGTVKYDQVKDI